ncbi:hypothetical protein AAG906_020473 [Vitis piasezkii]
MDPCLATPVFLWYLGFNFESMITLKLSLCHAVNWMIVERKRGSYLYLAFLCHVKYLFILQFEDSYFYFVHATNGRIRTSPKLGLPNVDEANISCNPLAPTGACFASFLQVINNCYNTHFQVPILPRLKLTTIISFFYGHYGGNLGEVLCSRMRNKFISKGHSAAAWHHACVHSPTVGHLGYAVDDFPEAEHDSPYARYDMPFHRTEEVRDTPIRHPPIIGARMEELAVVSDTRFYSMEDRMDHYQTGFTYQFEGLQQRFQSIEERMDQQ